MKLNPTAPAEYDKYRLLRWLPPETSSMDNKLKETRESMLMSKAELARKAHVSPLTINRIERDMPCRLETQRKILLALGLKPADKHKIFKD
jgi:DNA-binding XRE family transcriptional regulator